MLDGYSTALQRIQALLDEGSFVQLSPKNNGVITGYGSVGERLVFVYSQFGPVDSAHARCICWLIELALQSGSPVVGIMDSDGVALASGEEVLDAYGAIFASMGEASGIVPQISVIAGGCMGISSLLPQLSDFVIMSGGAKYFLESPAVQQTDIRALSTESAGSAENHSKNTGLAHLALKTEQEAISAAKSLLLFLPHNHLDSTQAISPASDVNYADSSLNAGRPGITSQQVLSAVCDNGNFFEIQKHFAKTMRIGFAMLNGQTVGIALNDGPLTADGADKAAWLVSFCDAYHIPLIFFTESGKIVYSSAEQRGILKAVARLVHASSNASVPKINIMYGDSSGSACAYMNVSADITFAWNTAKFTLMPNEAAEKLLACDSFESGGAYSLISPSETRKNLISALQMLSSKRPLRRPKKHYVVS